MNNAVILIIDDEAQIRKLLQITLESNDYRVVQAETAKEGMIAAATHPPDIILLDLGLPDIDGIEVLKELREWSTVPILILSVRNSEETIIRSLDTGADDYLTKPFRMGELLARLRTLLRHRLPFQEGSVFSAGNLTINLEARTVEKSGQRIKITPIEYSLLSIFVRNAGRVLTHHYILQQVWGPSYIDETQYLRVYIAQLRKKLEDDPSHPQLIQTESGIGYRLAF